MKWLTAFNSFGIKTTAEEIERITSVDQLRLTLMEQAGQPFKILGGGSNVLLTGPVKGKIFLNRILGIEKKTETETHQIVHVGGGVNWHSFVAWCIQNDLGGTENMSLIPGTMGAAPIQNIGAYGVEFKDICHSIESICIADGTFRLWQSDECDFGYRDSVFKQLPGQYFITAVYVKLTKAGHHVLKTSYGDIQKMLALDQIDNPTIADVSDAVIRIRQSKLPDPAELGNAGSFFKNPLVSAAKYRQLEDTFPGIPGYTQPDNTVKVPAGWLIEQAGWKGKRMGNAGCHVQQALVLVNYGEATGQEILLLANTIINAVEAKFGVSLQPEVKIW